MWEWTPNCTLSLRNTAPVISCQVPTMCLILLPSMLVWLSGTGKLLKYEKCCLGGRKGRTAYAYLMVKKTDPHYDIVTHWPLACWLHQMGTFSALLALCAANSLLNGEFPSQRPVMQSFDIFFDLHLNKQLIKQSWGWWFEMPSRPLRRHCNGRCGSNLTSVIFSNSCYELIPWVFPPN